MINDHTLIFEILGLPETDYTCMGINNKETLPRNNHVNIFLKKTSSDNLRLLNAGAPIDLLQMFTPFKKKIVTYVFDLDGEFYMKSKCF